MSDAEVTIPGPAAVPTKVDGSANPLMTIHPRGLQLQFVFFYDLKGRIKHPEGWEAPTRGEFEFEWRDVQKWSVAKHFSNNFPGELIALRCVRKRLPFQCMDGFEAGGWVLRSTGGACSAPVAAPETTFPAVECTLFKNGILSVLIRIYNATAVGHCADKIGHPDYLHLPHLPPEDDLPPSTERRYSREPGAGVRWAYDAMVALEPEIARFLNDCAVNVVAFGDGKERRLKVVRDADLQNPEPGTVGLAMSRPYVGAILSEHSVVWDGGGPTRGPDTGQGSQSDIREVVPPERKEALKALAVAYARTTPEFLGANNRFEDVEEYLEKGSVPRNIYYPGPSVVLIGRRGWTCIHMGQRNPELFQDGVVEPALFAIQAVYASARATRRHLVTILDDGMRIGHRLNMELTELMEREAKNGRSTLRRILSGFTVIQIGAHRDMEAAVLEYAGFLARARLNSPCDDASSLLDAHFTTHSGIAAVARLKLLTQLEGLLVAARATMQNYGAFLSTANAHWQAQAQRIQAARIVGSLFITGPLYALARIGGAGYALLALCALVASAVPVMLWPGLKRSHWPWRVLVVASPLLVAGFLWRYHAASIWSSVQHANQVSKDH